MNEQLLKSLSNTNRVKPEGRMKSYWRHDFQSASTCSVMSKKGQICGSTLQTPNLWAKYKCPKARSWKPNQVKRSFLYKRNQGQTFPYIFALVFSRSQKKKRILESYLNKIASIRRNKAHNLAATTLAYLTFKQKILQTAAATFVKNSQVFTEYRWWSLHHPCKSQILVLLLSYALSSKELQTMIFREWARQIIINKNRLIPTPQHIKVWLSCYTTDDGPLCNSHCKT